jgi:hypothetical protein
MNHPILKITPHDPIAVKVKCQVCGRPIEGARVKQAVTEGYIEISAPACVKCSAEPAKKEPEDRGEKVATRFQHFECEKHGVTPFTPVSLAVKKTSKYAAINRGYCMHCVIEKLDELGVREVQKVKSEKIDYDDPFLYSALCQEVKDE